MSVLVPFNRRNFGLSRTGFDDFYNMLDDFFSDSWLLGRKFMRDTFRIDVVESDDEYRIEADLPGVKKEDIDLGIDDDCLCISVNSAEEVNKDGKNYIHRERRASSMCRTIHLSNALLDETKAKLDNGVLTVTVPKDKKASNTRKIDIE